MSYSDFVSTFTYGFNLFLDSLFSFANYFITNYIFITIIGLSLFFSLFYFIYYKVLNYFHSSSNFDNYVSKHFNSDKEL